MDKNNVVFDQTAEWCTRTDVNEIMNWRTLIVISLNLQNILDMSQFLQLYALYVSLLHTFNCYGLRHNAGS